MERGWDHRRNREPGKKQKITESETKEQIPAGTARAKRKRENQGQWKQRVRGRGRDSQWLRMQNRENRADKQYGSLFRGASPSTSYSP